MGDARGVKNHVHIEDAASLYELLLSRVLNGEPVSSGERGVLFAVHGEHSWAQVSEAIAQTRKTLGILPSDEVKSLKLEEATKYVRYDGPE